MNELEKFKKDVMEGYIYPYIDKLLDIGNKIKKAKSFDEVSNILETEQKTLTEFFAKETENDTKNSEDI